jgi:hypothetical protein
LEEAGGITVSFLFWSYLYQSKRLRLTPVDNLVVQWGAQDNYEIVRKVGRGKYSEVSCGPGQIGEWS